MQRTIVRDTTLKGIGLHTGHSVTVTLRPLGPNMGVLFQRVDLPQKPLIKADVGSLLVLKDNPRRRTMIGTAEAKIQTIEHLMASLAGLGVDNILVEIDADELPGLDGSALGFVEALQNAGIVEQGVARRTHKITEPLWAADGHSSIVILPSSDFRVSYTLDYGHSFLSTQYIDRVIDAETFASQIAPARTFCLQEEAAALVKSGMGKGANYENTLVISAEGVVNNKLRFQDEFVRHKVIDLIGDLYLLGMPLKGHVIASKSGHALNIRLIQKIRQQVDQLQMSAIKSVAGAPKTGTIDAVSIMKILPHRYPFLLVDRVVSLEEGKRAVGIKNVTVNENFFEGHFPGRPVMPGVLIVEAMAQVGGVLMLSPAENRGKLAFFMAADNVKFRKPVVPGDQLRIEVEIGKIRSKTGQVFTKAYVGDDLAAEGELMFALVER